MIVDKASFNDILHLFSGGDFYAVDTETYGFRWWGDHHLFSIILADAHDSYYFNFKETPDHLGNFAPPAQSLPRSWIKELTPIFSNKASTWFMHNAKFDVGMLTKEGLSIDGTWHCTEAMARLLHTQFRNYSLDECMKRMAAMTGKPVPQKSDVVKKYILKHKLYDEILIPGKKKKTKDMHFDLVPFEIISPYGVADGTATYELGQYQRQKFNTELFALNKAKFGLDALKIIRQERKLTKVLFGMEKSGYVLDRSYTTQAANAEIKKIDSYKSSYKRITGEDFVDSGKRFKEAFEKFGQKITYTPKGRPSFTKDILKEMSHPLADVVLNIRKSQKKVSSYYTNFEYYSSPRGTLHANQMQGGTATGRMSVRDPAMQTIPKPDEESDDDLLDTNDSAAIRRCFIPPKDFCMFMPDYDQMEYRMMVDMAEQMDLIESIKGGLDVHSATAELVGVSRKAAKTVNFLLLYGGGVAKLADALGLSLNEAKNIKQRYFAKLPQVKLWTTRTINFADRDGQIVNWMGRRCKIDHGFGYKAPNYVIQGGCADAAKKAIVECQEYIDEHKLKSYMVGMVHDELHFYIHKSELKHCGEFVGIMESAYPAKHLKLTAGAAHSWVSWGDKQEGYPTLKGWQNNQKPDSKKSVRSS